MATKNLRHFLFGNLLNQEPGEKRHYGDFRFIVGAGIAGAAIVIASAGTTAALAVIIGTGVGAAVLAFLALAATYWKDAIKSAFGRWFGHGKSVEATPGATPADGFNPAAVAGAAGAGPAPAVTQADQAAPRSFYITPRHNKMSNGSDSQFFWPSAVKPSPELEAVAKVLDGLISLPTNAADIWQHRFDNNPQPATLITALNAIKEARLNGLSRHDRSTPKVIDAISRVLNDLTSALNQCSTDDLNGLSYFTRAMSFPNATLPNKEEGAATSFRQSSAVHAKDQSSADAYLLDGIDSRIVGRLSELRTELRLTPP